MPPAARALQQRNDRRAICALVAVFALLVQMLTPMAAMAADGGIGGQVICTAAGAVQGAASPTDRTPPQGPHDGGSCDHCVCPVAAAPPASGLALAAEPVLYASVAEHGGLGADICAPGRGLAAPPPPARGPPALMI